MADMIGERIIGPTLLPDHTAGFIARPVSLIPRRQGRRSERSIWARCRLSTNRSGPDQCRNLP